MTFARLFAAFGSILVLIPPLRYGLRYWTGVQRAPGIATTVLYSVCLVLLYCALAVLGYALRRWMVFTGEWEREGLVVLDRGAWTPAPLFSATFASAVLILSSLFGGHTFGEAGVAEALFLAAFTFSGLIAPQALPAPIDPYDPLPQPVPIPPPVFPDPGDGIPLHMAWHFLANPGLNAGAATEFAMDLNASRKRYDSYMARDHKTPDWQSFGRFVGDGLTPEVDAAARQWTDHRPGTPLWRAAGDFPGDRGSRYRRSRQSELTGMPSPSGEYEKVAPCADFHAPRAALCTGFLPALARLAGLAPLAVFWLLSAVLFRLAAFFVVAFSGATVAPCCATAAAVSLVSTFVMVVWFPFSLPVGST